MKEALEFHVQGMIEDGNEVPQWLVEGDYEFKWCLKDTASLLQSLEGMTTIAAISRATGINERLLSNYANGFKRPSAKQHQKIVITNRTAMISVIWFYFQYLGGEFVGSLNDREKRAGANGMDIVLLHLLVVEGELPGSHMPTNGEDFVICQL